jgi:hypothetical protein
MVSEGEIKIESTAEADKEFPVGKPSKRASLGILLSGAAAKLKEPKYRAVFIVGGAVFIFVVVLSVVLIVVGLSAKKNSGQKVQVPQEEATEAPLTSGDPLQEQLDDLKVQVENYDLEDRPLLLPEVDFDIEF